MLLKTTKVLVLFFHEQFHDLIWLFFFLWLRVCLRMSVHEALINSSDDVRGCKHGQPLKSGQALSLLFLLMYLCVCVCLLCTADFWFSSHYMWKSKNGFVFSFFFVFQSEIRCQCYSNARDINLLVPDREFALLQSKRMWSTLLVEDLDTMDVCFFYYSSVTIRTTGKKKVKEKY